jgi:formylglycine-generating enzyme required for sulfatase activity
MPKAAQLPENLMPLSLYQAMPLRGESFTPDALAIAERLRAVLAQRRSGVPAWGAGLGIAAALAAGIAAGPMALNVLGLPFPGVTLPGDAQLRAALAGAGEQLSAAEDNLKAARQRSVEADRAAQAAQRERDEARNDADAARSALATANTDMTAAKQRVADAERAARDAQQALSKQVAATERERNDARAEVSNANAKIAELEKRVKEQTTRPTPVLPTNPAPLQTFRGCSECPEMVVVPAGTFMMGSEDDRADEKPAHEVRIPRPFAVGKYEVTFAEWDACAADGGCTSNNRPPDEGWGRGRRPVVNVSWNDAKEYAAWLSRKTGQAYRLLTEAEWEYAARAGTTTQYAFGDAITDQQAQFRQSKTAEVNRFQPNAWGLHDMHGNVWEWCEDNWHENYIGNPPTDGSSWSGGDGSFRVLRGGSWSSNPQFLRSATRSKDRPVYRYNGFGFRVARTL